MQIPNPLDDYADNSPSLALETDKYIMFPLVTLAVIGLIVAACTNFKLP